MSTERFTVAAIQLVSGPDVDRNLTSAAGLIAEAAGHGARLVVLPENFAILGRRDTDKLSVRERDGAGPIQAFLAETARAHRLWLIGGSVPLEATSPDRVRNTCLVYDDRGSRVARYDKIHLFGFEAGEERYREADTVEPGAGGTIVVDSPFGRIGLSVCYDVRFPELYRRLGEVDMIVVPSAFTVPTGRAHWEVLLRARAIENQAYVIAPAQGGEHPGGRRTHGHSMIIDPWGTVLAVRPEGPGVVLAEVDRALIDRVRASLPALEHRTL